MRLIFSGCTGNTAACQHRQPFTLILPLSRLAVAWLCSDWLWSRCLTCQDVFANLVTKMETRNIAHRYAIFFCVKLGDSATTTHGKLQQAFGDDAMSRAQAFRWHKVFSEGRNIIEDEQRSGRPSATQTSDNTAWVRELVRSNRRLTVKMIADEVNVTREAVRRILTEELWMRKNLCQDGAQKFDKIVLCSAVFDIQRHCGEAAASLLTWSRTLRLLIISKSKIGKKDTILNQQKTSRGL